MRVYRGFAHAVSEPVVLAIGNFDGVHRGHVALVGRLQEAARRFNAPATVLTFEPHPREYFTPEAAPARLSILREKLELLSGLGVAQAMVCRFDQAFAALSAEAFVDQVLLRALRVRHVIVGDDFRFGQGRQGDLALLQRRGAEAGFSVESMSTVMLDDVRVSSSAVRRALAEGDLDLAARLLGRSYIMDGQVVHGNQIGRQLGFATANLRIRHNPLPLSGVFAVEVTGLGDKALPGVANLGIRPTIGGTRPLLEVHIFDFDQNIYGAHVSVRFLHKLRAEQRFPNFDALKAQIAADAVSARAYFKL